MMALSSVFNRSLTLLTFMSGLSISVGSAIAGEIKPSRVHCYFFEGEQIALHDANCIHQGWSWTGGGGTTLKWSDGVSTKYQWGLQGRGTPVCPEGQEQVAIDGVCGTSYKRHMRTLERLNSSWANRPGQDHRNMVHCVQLEGKSVCWLFR